MARYLVYAVEYDDHYGIRIYREERIATIYSYAVEIIMPVKHVLSHSLDIEKYIPKRYIMTVHDMRVYDNVLEFDTFHPSIVKTPFRKIKRFSKRLCDVLRNSQEDFEEENPYYADEESTDDEQEEYVYDSDAINNRIQLKEMMEIDSS